MKTTINAILLTLYALLAGCSLGGGPAPDDHYYRLPDAQVETQQRRYSRVVINPPRATGVYHDRALLYVEQATPLEIHRYHYHYWSAPPESLVQEHFVNWWSTSGLAEQVNTSPVEDADLVLDSRLLAFERLVGGEGIRVKATIAFSVRKASTSGLVWSKDYTQELTPDDGQMHSTAAAYGRALDDIMQRLVKDLAEKD